MQIGIDIGGSHIGVGIVSESGKVAIKKEWNFREEEENFLQKTSEMRKEQITDKIIQMIQEVLKEAGAPLCILTNIGIASPGRIKQGVICHFYNLGIEDFRLKEELESFYQVPVSIRNDAKCAGLAERRFGALRDYEDSVFLCLGTGIGGAIFYQGELVQPKVAAGAEFGHMIIQKEGRLCKCGNQGCFETYASMNAFKTGLIELLQLPKEVSSIVLLEQLLQRKREEKVKAYVEKYVDYLVLGLSNICKIVEPEVICLGGSFVYYEQVLYQELKRQLKDTHYSFPVPEVVLAELGNNAGMIGAVL